MVHGDIPVKIHGQYAGLEKVAWLNEGFKTLEISTKLSAVHFSVIKAIELNPMTLMFTTLVAKMVIGNIPIHGVPFSVTTTLPSLHTFHIRAHIL